MSRTRRQQCQRALVKTPGLIVRMIKKAATRDDACEDKSHGDGREFPPELLEPASYPGLHRAERETEFGGDFLVGFVLKEGQI